MRRKMSEWWSEEFIRVVERKGECFLVFEEDEKEGGSGEV